MKKVIFTISAVFIYLFSFSQTPVNLEVISSAGDYFAPPGSNVTLSWTLGEPVIETFAPNGSTVVLTQGFQQPSTNQAGKYTIDGYVTYDNTAANPLASTKMVLVNSELKRIDSVSTDALGHFLFSNVVNGSYTFILIPSKAFGGVNPSDALLGNRFFISTYTFKDALSKKAGDVNSDNKVNPTDALAINRRFIKVITAYTNKTPDWTFENPTVVVADANVTQNIKGLCTGDINASLPFAKSLENCSSIQWLYKCNSRTGI